MTKEQKSTANQSFQELQVLRESKYENDALVETFSKIRTIRPVVKITDAEANSLNEGILKDSRNTIFSLYVKDENELNEMKIIRRSSKA
jgi:hypothetical protein